MEDRDARRNSTDSLPIVVPNATRITSIVISDTDVYMAGPSNGRGVYWKNGAPVTIANAFEIDYLAVSGGNVYAVGGDKSANTAFWINDNETDLTGTLPPGIGSSTTPTGIAVSGNDVYVTAAVFFVQSPGDTSYYNNSAVYWKNGNIDIDADTMAWCGYWKDSVQVNLSFRSGDNYAWTSGVAVSGSDVYIAGTSLVNGVSQALYWKNGNIVALPNGGQTTPRNNEYA